MKALGLAVSEKKIFFYVFPIVCLWELMTPGAGPLLNTGAWLAGFIKRKTTHCYIKIPEDQWSCKRSPEICCIYWSINMYEYYGI